MCKWSGIFDEAYDLRYSCQMSIMYDWKGDIRGLAKDKEGHNKTTVSNQYGFIFSALAYAAVYIKSYLHWKREE